MVTIYHNPRCSKSRQGLKMIQDSNQEYRIVEYLKDTPTANELKAVLEKLQLQAEAIVRKGESVYKEQFKGRSYSHDEWIQILVENPILIERPIAILGDRAVIGRPPENIMSLF